MGVPVFFKWLTMRNPKIIRDAVEPQVSAYASGNPSVDNFYIDMNGLIHPACNPRGENIKIPKNFQQQCANIYDYIDKLINIVRPRKTLYLAIDGVAPRAKMNQQRSRRFRAAIQGAERTEKKMQLLQKFKQIGAWSQQVQDQATKKGFDSNVITPGTQFLNNVSNKIRQYVKNRLENHLFWKNLIVVFSDANCPGEGQHKIMDFVRQQRASNEYSMGQSHCIYGADADLIMLSLATHEPRFYIIREVVITEKDKFCTNCNQRGHFFMDCNQATSIQDEARVRREQHEKSINVQFQFIRIQMVREYIHINYFRSTIPFGYNLERIIDDFIFLCFFVGNDFLPHVPCLSIREGGIDVLMKVYEYCLSIMPDYITDAGNLNMRSLKIFIEQMTYYEQQLIKEMIIRQNNNKQRQMNNRSFQQRQKNKNKSSKTKYEQLEDQVDLRDPIGSFKAAMQKLNKEDPFNLDDYSVFNHNIFNYKEKFYKEKFKISASQFLQLKSNVSRCYVEALKWICAYYYKGVPSWSWFYPFHYSPFFTDLLVPEQGIQQFDVGYPFKPFEQLMAVLPPKTCDALPKYFHYFMKDVKSPIIDYYPSDFHIDLVGKKFAWLGQVILPFIDDRRLLSAMGDYEQKLTQQQRYRNRFGTINLYINKYGNLGRRINKDTKMGETMQLTWQKGHEVQGSALVIQQDTDFIGFQFDQPLDRIHKIQLLQSKSFNPLEEIDDAFIQRTDKAAFGGMRYVKIVSSILAERRMSLRKGKSQQNYSQPLDKQDRRQNSRNQQNGNEDRQRSRQKNRNYSRPYHHHSGSSHRSDRDDRDKDDRGNRDNRRDNYRDSRGDNRREHREEHREHRQHRQDRDKDQQYRSRQNY